jgi:ornithine decarboxylase
MTTIERTGVLSRVIHRPGHHPALRSARDEQPQRRGVMPRELAGLDVDRAITALLALRRELPDVRIHVATTALPHPAAIRAVDAFGASFAVASRHEVDLLEREGVAIGRCVHTTPVKTIADITGAYLRGIRTFVIDDPAEVAKFQELPDAAVLVRLSTRDSGQSARLIVRHCLRAGLRVAGFTLHDEGEPQPTRPWARVIRRTLALMRRLERAYGIRFDTLDLGGLVVGGGEATPAPVLAGVARDIRRALADAPSRYRVLIEPGRAVAAAA